MTKIKLDNSQMSALAFVIMVAIISVLWDLGRASAHRAVAMHPTVAASASLATPSAASAQYGLIQTGVVGVASLDATGQPTAMPVFQVVRLAAPHGYATANTSAAAEAPRSPAADPATHAPSGISVAPSINPTGTLCDVSTVRVITPSADACLSAGGHVLAGN